ncbi:hypothetical protein ACFXJ8_15975 [Nonomuraea sp. NPDC059194]|uniref:hypothetical protein n=1 Tax=Nonomuraea sp. NPDC059194 TaxID=3346764 RepID=UPI00369EFFBB
MIDTHLEKPEELNQRITELLATRAAPADPPAAGRHGRSGQRAPDSVCTILTSTWPHLTHSGREIPGSASAGRRIPASLPASQGLRRNVGVSGQGGMLLHGHEIAGKIGT